MLREEKNPINFLARGFESVRKSLACLQALRIIMESLILAQNERWRRVLSMQVERQARLRFSLEWRTGE